MKIFLRNLRVTANAGPAHHRVTKLQTPDSSRKACSYNVTNSAGAADFHAVNFENRMNPYWTPYPSFTRRVQYYLPLGLFDKEAIFFDIT